MDTEKHHTRSRAVLYGRVVAHFSFWWVLGRERHRLYVVKRFSPLVLIAVVAAAAFALLRTHEEAEPAEEWKPVRPS